MKTCFATRQVRMDASSAVQEKLSSVPHNHPLLSVFNLKLDLNVKEKMKEKLTSRMKPVVVISINFTFYKLI